MACNNVNYLTTDYNLAGGLGTHKLLSRNGPARYQPNHRSVSMDVQHAQYPDKIILKLIINPVIAI